ncbi:hypothetical protein [Larkinella ripae]
MSPLYWVARSPVLAFCLFIFFHRFFDDQSRVRQPLIAVVDLFILFYINSIAMTVKSFQGRMYQRTPGLAYGMINYLKNIFRPLIDQDHPIFKRSGPGRNAWHQFQTLVRGQRFEMAPILLVQHDQPGRPMIKPRLPFTDLP